MNNEVRIETTTVKTAGFDGVQAAVLVTNLTDKFYYQSLFLDQFITSGMSGVVGAPRMWAVTLRRNF